MERRLKFEVLGEAINLCKSKKCGCKHGDDGADGCGECQDCDPCFCKECACKGVFLGEEDVVAMLPEAVKNIKRRYESLRRTFKDIDPWVVQEMFLNSISSMYDPHTRFLSRDSFEDFNVRIHNSLIGIGAELADENGVCTINKLTPGGPAQLSGEIKSGDKIVAVAQGDDGEFVDIVGLRLYKTVKLLRGKKDTIVRIKLETVTGDTKVVRLIRNNIRLNEARASAKYFELEKNGTTVRLGVIELPSFYGDSDRDKEQYACARDDVNALIEILKGKGIDGLVLDLRQNGGGLLDRAISIAGLFITTGPVVQVKNSSGTIEQFFDDDANVAWRGPLVILSSSMSASASDILIGALRDHTRAVIVGAETTYGTGSVQAILDMNMHFQSFRDSKNLGAAYITVQKWYLPTGLSTQLMGVPSDIKLVGLDECFHRREADYPHALKWDTIPSAEMGSRGPSPDGSDYVDDNLIKKLDALSKVRQESLEEFSILRARIERFDGIVNRKDFTLKISTRLQEKQLDDAVKNEIENSIKILAETQSYRCENISLPDVVGEEDDNNVANGAGKPQDDVDSIAIFDTNMREALRIVADWVEIVQPSKFGIGVFVAPWSDFEPRNLQR
jgi:carboxyl-terminal processing protease